MVIVIHITLLSTEEWLLGETRSLCRATAADAKNTNYQQIFIIRAILDLENYANPSSKGNIAPDHQQPIREERTRWKCAHCSCPQRAPIELHSYALNVTAGIVDDARNLVD